MKPEDAKAVAALQANWRAERETALVYRDLAANEADEKRRGILLRMAEAEERHALRWEDRLHELGAEPPVLKNDWRRHLNRWWNRAAGAEVAIRRMEAAEDRDKERYEAQRAAGLGTNEDEKEFLRQTALEEKAHSRILNTMSAPPSSLGPQGSPRHDPETRALARTRRRLGGGRDLRGERWTRRGLRHRLRRRRGDR